MAWVDLSSAFGFGTVLTSAQMQNLRDNISAAFAKDSGAPQLASNYVTSGMISDHPFGAEDFQTGTDEGDWVIAAKALATSVGASNTVRWQWEPDLTPTGGAHYYSSNSPPVTRKGTVRVRYTITTGSGNTGDVYIYRNGSQVASRAISASTSGVTYSTDISCSVGDFFQISVDPATGDYIQCRNMQLCASGELFV